MTEPHHLEALLDEPDPAFAPVRHGHFTFTSSGLTVDESDGVPDYEEWANVGNVLGTMERGLAFMIGDWIRYGEDRYKELASQVIDARQWKPETVRNYVWLAASVNPENRMVDHGLFVKHHQIVARMPAPRQRYWLQRAVRGDGGGERWTVSRLQAEIKADEQHGELRETGWYLMVSCSSAAQRDNLQHNLEREGLSCRPSTRRETVYVSAQSQAVGG